MKIYKIKKNSTEKNLIHIDAYRLKSSKDILDLGWKDLITHPSNIILVEWAENIKKALPKPHFLVKISHIKEVERGVDICLSK
jgi:tRNA A37 threonylcarbamoyladenosine biosynthesis protein TsaE